MFGNIDFLGAPREMRSEEQLRVISEEYEDISFVILSDVWLDQPKVRTKSAYSWTARTFDFGGKLIARKINAIDIHNTQNHL